MNKLITPLIVLAVLLGTVVFVVLEREPDPFADGDRGFFSARETQRAPRPVGHPEDRVGGLRGRDADGMRSEDVRFGRNGPDDGRSIRDGRDGGDDRNAPRDAYRDGLPHPGDAHPEGGRRSDEQRHLDSLSTREKQRALIKESIRRDEAEAGGTDERTGVPARSDRPGPAGASAAPTDEGSRKERPEPAGGEARDGRPAPSSAEDGAGRSGRTADRERRDDRTAEKERRDEPRAERERREETARPREEFHEDDLPTLGEAMRQANARYHPPVEERRRREPRDDGLWRVQAGAYADPARADRVVGLLRDLGVRAEIHPLNRPGEPLYRVWSPAMTRADANRLSRELENRGIPAKVFK